MDGGRADRGFTLIELIIVISIIAILASIAVPNLLAAKLAANETSAVATLRSLYTSQAMIQGSARIDADNDAIGEFGTFLELSGRTGVRRGYAVGPVNTSSFSTQGPPLVPPVVSASLSAVGGAGHVTKSGYAFLILLPDASTPEARFVHEANAGTIADPVPQFSVSGQPSGVPAVHVNLSEQLWCAYAVPVARTTSGSRAFFVGWSGDVLQCANETARHGGVGVAIDGRSAFLGDGITGAIAIGHTGRDDEVWKIAN